MASSRPAGARSTDTRMGTTRIVLATVAVVGVLLWATVNVIAEPFYYLGYRERSYDLGELAISAVGTVALAVSCPVRWRWPSAGAYSFLGVTIAVPVLWIPVLYGPLSTGQLLLLQASTVTCFAIIRMCTAGSSRMSRPPGLDVGTFWVGAVVVAVAGVAYLFISTGISPTVLQLSDVYEQRSLYAGNVTSLGQYAVGWIGAGLLPVILVTGLWTRRPSMAGAGAGGVVLLYTLTGNKSYLVGVALSLVGYALARPGPQRGYGWMVALAGAMGAGTLASLTTSSILPASMLVRRAMSTAGINTAYFVHYFDTAPTYQLRHSVLSAFGAPPSELNPARLIGLVYYGTADNNANANFIADGYANFGVVGVLGAALVVGLALRAYDGLAQGLPLQVSMPAMMLILVALANTAPLTVILTHGGLALALVVSAMPRETFQRRPTASGNGGVEEREGSARPPAVAKPVYKKRISPNYPPAEPL